MEQFYENGVLITPMSEEDQRYTKSTISTLQKLMKWNGTLSWRELSTFFKMPVEQKPVTPTSCWLSF